MEGSGTADVEGRGKQASVGEQRGRDLPMRAAGAGADVLAASMGVQMLGICLDLRTLVLPYLKKHAMHYNSKFILYLYRATFYVFGNVRCRVLTCPPVVALEEHQRHAISTPPC
jgi:hypothetical protein